MRSISYGAFEDLLNGGLNHCNRASFDMPLVVNCSGVFSTESLFTTNNRVGRCDYYLLYVVSGSLSVEMPSGWEVCESGNFIVFPPETKYVYSHGKSDGLEYMWTHFTGSKVTELLSEYGIKIYPKINKVINSDRITTAFRSLFDGFSKQDSFRDRELALLFERLLIILARRVKDGSDKLNRLRKSIAFINSHYNHNIPIPELANIENLSVSRYNTLFRQMMGISPTTYITRLRITSAKELLVSTDLSINKISKLVGYPDSHFFSRVFKATLGVSPSEYRK